MKDFIGNMLILIGILLGIFIGGYLMLYGGIVQIVEAINPTSAKDIAIGIIKILFSSLGFYIPFLAGYFFGQAIKYN